jgi:hypothetical protein
MCLALTNAGNIAEDDPAALAAIKRAAALHDAAETSGDIGDRAAANKAIEAAVAAAHAAKDARVRAYATKYAANEANQAAAAAERFAGCNHLGAWLVTHTGRRCCAACGALSHEVSIPRAEPLLPAPAPYVARFSYPTHPGWLMPDGSVEQWSEGSQRFVRVSGPTNWSQTTLDGLTRPARAAE